MGTVDLRLASELASALELRRAVETGTYRGGTARSLARAFPQVITIELSAELYQAAVARLADEPRVRPLHGHSGEVLKSVVDAGAPALYFLDGHWSLGSTAGAEDECPVLDELAAIESGHPDDCILIDDARLFATAPPPPHNPERWPTLLEVFDAIRARWPEHLITVVDDQIIAVPMRARAVLDRYGQRVAPQPPSGVRALPLRIRRRAREFLQARRPAANRA